jgi:hypothetical protein
VRWEFRATAPTAIAARSFAFGSVGIVAGSSNHTVWATWRSELLVGQQPRVCHLDEHRSALHGAERNRTLKLEALADEAKRLRPLVCSFHEILEAMVSRTHD